MSPSPTAPTSVLLRSDGILLEVLTAGTAVRRLEVAGPDGAPVGLVLGHADPLTYVTDGGYLGATIGRLGNRIAGGRFDLDGQTHALSVNEGDTTLHGGLDGFDRRAWTVRRRDATSVSLGLHSPDGDQGFPGSLEVTVTYSVAPGVVSIDYVATADRGRGTRSRPARAFCYTRINGTRASIRPRSPASVVTTTCCWARGKPRRCCATCV